MTWRACKRVHGGLLVEKGDFCLDLPDNLVLDVAKVVYGEHLFVPIALRRLLPIVITPSLGHLLLGLGVKH